MRYLLLSLAHLVCFTAQAQDLILTIEGDSINARITKEKKDFLYFTFKHQDEVRHTLLPYSQVQEYVYNYFEQPEVSPEQVSPPDNYPHWRWALHGGYSRRLARISDEVPDVLREHTRQLKSGFNLGTDVAYYLSETIGLGGRYTFFSASNRFDDGSVTIDRLCKM